MSKFVVSSNDNLAFLYFLLDPRHGDNVTTINESSEKDVFYVAESETDVGLNQYLNYALKNGELFDRKQNRMDQIRTHSAETLHPKLPVSIKEIAGNLESILVERSPTVMTENAVKSTSLIMPMHVLLLIEMIFKLKMTSDD